MPQRIRLLQLREYHQIEVEDDVTAYLEYDSGTTGVFITSTEKHQNQPLKACGTMGNLVVEMAAHIFPAAS